MGQLACNIWMELIEIICVLVQLGDGLVYEAAADDSSKVFPHFYGPSRSFGPLPLDVVTKAEKIILSGTMLQYL